MPGRVRLPGAVLVVAAAVCWGTGGLAGSVLGSGSVLSPVAVGCYRLAVAAVVLLAVQAVSRQIHGLLGAVAGLVARRGDAVRVLGVGLGLAVFQLCYFVAVRELGVSVATLLTLGLAPVLVTAVAGVLLGERAGPRLRVAMPAALVGLVLLVGVGVGVGAVPGSGGSSPVGVLAACTSAAGYAAVTLLGRSLSARVQPAHVTTLGFVVAASASLPVGLAAGMGFVPDLRAVVLVAYLGVVPTALAYTLFFAGLRRTASGTASVLTLVEPLTATLLAVLLLGERLGPVQWCGAALLLGAVLALSLPDRRRMPTLGG